MTFARGDAVIIVPSEGEPRGGTVVRDFVFRDNYGTTYKAQGVDGDGVIVAGSARVFRTREQYEAHVRVKALRLAVHGAAGRCRDIEKLEAAAKALGVDTPCPTSN